MKFKSSKHLEELIEAYFNEPQEPLSDKKTGCPPTLSGLAFYLGFESRKAFEEYEQNGKLAHLLKRSRLRIEAEYEKQLHRQPSSGAIFALKNMGWNEKHDSDAIERFLTGNIKIEIIQSGPAPASSEKEVDLS